MKQYVDVIGLHTSCMEALNKPLTQLWARVKTAPATLHKGNRAIYCLSGREDEVFYLVYDIPYYRHEYNVYGLLKVATLLGIDPTAFLSDKPHGVYSLEIELV